MYLKKEGLDANNLQVGIVIILEEYNSYFSTIQMWTDEFRRGRESVEITLMVERPATDISKKKIDCLYHWLTDDWQ